MTIFLAPYSLVIISTGKTKEDVGRVIWATSKGVGSGGGSLLFSFTVFGSIFSNFFSK